VQPWGWLLGGVNIDTWYWSLRATGVAKVNAPLALTFKVLPRLFSKAKLLSVSGPLLVAAFPARPTTVPPTLNVTAGQVIETVVTLEVTVPLPVPGATTQVCTGAVGCAKMDTVYAVPVGTSFVNVNA
jgi:hypothetical protein